MRSCRVLLGRGLVGRVRGGKVVVEMTGEIKGGVLCICEVSGV